MIIEEYERVWPGGAAGAFLVKEFYRDIMRRTESDIYFSSQ